MLVQGIVTVLQDDTFYQSHMWTKSIALFLAAIAVYFLGRYLNTRPGRIVIDKITGKEIELKRIHSLLFLRFEYWGFILAAVAIAILFIH